MNTGTPPAFNTSGNGFHNPCERAEADQNEPGWFHRYGDQYFLAQIWTAGNDMGNELPKSGRETEVATDNPAHNVVVVATLR